MKKIIFTLITCFVVTSLQAQYSNTSWKGTFKIPDDYECILSFSNDSLSLKLADGSPVEFMKYTINKDTLSITKLDGKSPCDYTTAAIYKIEIKNSRLYISPLKDDCNERADAWPTDGMIKND